MKMEVYIYIYIRLKAIIYKIYIYIYEYMSAPPAGRIITTETIQWQISAKSCWMLRCGGMFARYVHEFRGSICDEPSNGFGALDLVGN